METTLDHLGGGWWVYQLKRGHRFSTDDVLTARAARRARPDALRLLDLGSGIGSIGLFTLLGLPPEARLVAVEVQAISAQLARQSVAYNGLESRVELREGDLRDPAVLDGAGLFDLITANPPYIPPGAGLVSPYPQRAQARVEAHGDVFDYCRVVARHLAPEGRFCLCFAAADPRPERAIAAAGLHVHHQLDVVFRHGRGPMICVRTCGREPKEREVEQFLVRSAEGPWTSAYQDARRELGMIA